MNIVIDVDDTLTETTEFLAPFVMKYFALDKEKYDLAQINYDDLPEGIKGREKEFGKEIFEKVLLDVPVKKNAISVIDRLIKDGHKIFIITAGNEELYRDPFNFTTKQLSKLGINYSKLYCTFDKRSICEKKKIDVFIDDNIENLLNSAEVVSERILFTSKMNINKKTALRRVSSWNEIYDYICMIERG